MADKQSMKDACLSSYERFQAEHEHWDYQVRFCYELVELEDRVVKLTAFLADKAQLEKLGIEGLRLTRLNHQLGAMQTYLFVMQERYDSEQL